MLSIDDLVVYIAAGIILGGRVGYILFYNLPFFIAHPLDMLQVWNGGMSFHGGLIGTALAMILFARRYHVALDSVTDAVAAVVPIGLCLGRLANFIKPELRGRPTDVPWAMIFPGSDGMPRHPSQLYEAGLEGVALFVLLWIVIFRGGLRRDGLVTALQLLAVVAQSGKPVSEICNRFEPLPQILKNVRFEPGRKLPEAKVTAALEAGRVKLGAGGRLIIRASGTEPVVRVMGEGDNHDLVERVVDDVCEALSAAA